MPFDIETKQSSEIHTLMFTGTLTGADLQAFASSIIAPFRQGGSSVIIDLDKITEIAESVVAYLYKLNDELLGRGAGLVIVRPQGDIPSRAPDGEHKNNLHIEQNRHIALGELMTVLNVKLDLLEKIQKTERLVYTVPEQPDSPAYSGTFVRNIQNFLVIDPGDDYDRNLRKGVKLRFTFEMEEEAKVVTFDAEVYKFAILKGRKIPCLVIRVPDLLDVQDKRRDPRLEAELRISFWGVRGDRTPRPGMVTNISASGFQFRCSRCDHSIGAEILVEIDFKVFKFSTAQKARIVRSEYGPQAQLYVGCEFTQLFGRDQGLLEDYLMNYC